MIGWYVHHHGMGHLQRLRAVAPHLRIVVGGLSSLPAPKDWTGQWVQLPRDDTPAPGPADDATAHARLHWAPLHHDGYRERMAKIANWIAQHRPSVMVVDVSVEVAVLCRSLGVPVVVVGMRGDRFDPPHALAYDLADAIVVPWPESTAEPDWSGAWLNKTVHCGALSVLDDQAERVLLDAGDSTASARTVACLLGYGGADVTSADLAAAQTATPRWRWSFPEPGADPAPLLAGASVVVAHAGQGAVAEVAALRRPAIVVAQRRPHDEQLATVRALRRADIAVAVEQWPKPDLWPGLLDSAVRAGGGGWERWSDRRGGRRFATAIDTVADRHRR